MKFLRDILDKLHPMFTKGGKAERLYPLYEAGDTIPLHARRSHNVLFTRSR